MNQKKSSWSDLGPRLLSALVLLAVALGALYLGGVAFNLLIVVICGAVFHEMTRLIGSPGAALPLAVLCVLAILAALNMGGVLDALHLPKTLNGLNIINLWSWPVLLVPAVVGLFMVKQRRGTFFLWAALIALAGQQIAFTRGLFGPNWTAWFLATVIATDVAGYFGGKFIGGPKLWPRLSPGKTWAGTLSGWLAAAAVGYFFYRYIGTGISLVTVSVLIAMASQAADLAQSALKRSSGVKDSGQILPGHGGAFDRFDGMIGGAMVLKGAAFLAMNFAFFFG